MMMTGGKIGPRMARDGHVRTNGVLSRKLKKKKLSKYDGVRRLRANNRTNVLLKVKYMSFVLSAILI